MNFTVLVTCNFCKVKRKSADRFSAKKTNCSCDHEGDVVKSRTEILRIKTFKSTKKKVYSEASLRAPLLHN